MKKLIILLFLLIPSLLFAQDYKLHYLIGLENITYEEWWQEARMSLAVVAGGVPAAGCTSVTVDLWHQLETVPTGGLWTLVDASGKLSASASGELATIKCPNGTPDTGTNGVTWAGGASSQAYYTFASAKTTLSTGIWFKTATHANYTDNITIQEICEVADCSAGFTAKFFDGKSSGETHTITGISVSAATWYWLTVQFNRNAASSWALYDSSGNQVGTTQSFTGFDATVASVSLFPRQYDAVTTAPFWDDLIVDWTDSTFPLGP